jgi:hypothetical protein
LLADKIKQLGNSNIDCPSTLSAMEEQQASSLAAAFPSPPPFWKSFTPENLTQIAALRSAELSFPRQPQDAAKEVPVRILDLPSELRYLQPPEPPVDGVHRCFGDPFRVSRMGDTVFGRYGGTIMIANGC